MRPTRRTLVMNRALNALPLGAIGGCAALGVWELLDLSRVGILAAGAGAAAAMAFAGVHALFERPDDNLTSRGA